MGSDRYQEINVTLSAATFSRLEQANPFKRGRAADQAIEVIRAALYTMYPPGTPDEWKERGHRVLDSQDPAEGHKIWRDIRRAIWKRVVNADRV